MDRKAIVLAACAAAAGTLIVPAGPALGAEPDPAQILESRCAGCHQPEAGGALSRIGEARKTPEGWDMTIVRMMLVHGVEIPAPERRALVRHLADTQGLAPSEAAPYRYALEREPAAVEAPPDDELAVMCARCHTWARIGLQRRGEAEWLRLVHFHLGQWPTIEYQALGRDRNWWDIASGQVPGRLADLLPFESEAWSRWRQRPHRDLSGIWRIAGHRPGHGAYEGTLRVSAEAPDRYRVSMSLRYASGGGAEGRGEAVVYTGYEWRGRVGLGEERIRQVLALSEDGRELAGRWYLADSDSLGASLRAVRAGGEAGARILSVEPAYLRAGETRSVAVHGVGLGGAIDLGAGVAVVRVVSRDPQTVVVEARAAPDAAAGRRTVHVGGTSAPGALVVYRRVDSVRVEPGYAIARVGGAGGPLPPVPAQFDAVAYANGPDGEAGTDDDVRIGVFPAEWSVADFNEGAAAMGDVRFAGRIEPTGLFVPAGAGLNPRRKYRTNNAGDLAVKARVTDGGRTVEGSAHLIVTVQRWNDPPIR